MARCWKSDPRGSCGLMGCRVATSGSVKGSMVAVTATRESRRRRAPAGRHMNPSLACNQKLFVVVGRRLRRPDKPVRVDARVGQRIPHGRNHRVRVSPTLRKINVDVVRARRCISKRETQAAVAPAATLLVALAAPFETERAGPLSARRAGPPLPFIPGVHAAASTPEQGTVIAWLPEPGSSCWPAWDRQDRTPNAFSSFWTWNLCPLKRRGRPSRTLRGAVA